MGHRELKAALIQIIPELIPRMEQKILCAKFLEAVLRSYEDPKSRGSARGKEDTRLDKRTAGQLRRDYPNYVPLDVAVASARNSGMPVSIPSDRPALRGS